MTKADIVARIAQSTGMTKVDTAEGAECVA